MQSKELVMNWGGLRKPELRKGPLLLLLLPQIKSNRCKRGFLTKLRDQSALYKASASDSAAYRAAQLGITTEAAPLIAAIKQQEEATRRDAEQKRLAAISARGLKDAIKQLGAEERAAAQATKAQENADLSAATAKKISFNA